MATLTEYELDELIRRAPKDIRPQLTRLLQELRDLRDQQAAREFMHSQEVAW